jgi:hypothetical protein
MFTAPNSRRAGKHRFANLYQRLTTATFVPVAR